MRKSIYIIYIIIAFSTWLWAMDKAPEMESGKACFKIKPEYKSMVSLRDKQAGIASLDSKLAS